MKNNEKYSSVKHRVKLFTTILSWTIFVLLIFIASVLVYYFVTTRIYAKKNVNYRPAFGLYTIISPSMEKTLNIYDVIVNVKVKNPNDIKVGDIITFISTSSSSKGMTITHRVIEITDGENGKLYKTKGDNNTIPDPKPATFENVIGKVIFKIPQLGRLQSILTTKMGWLILVVIPAFIIILFDILKLIRLHGAEKSIEEIVDIDNKKKEKVEEKKKLIEEKLTKKYKVKRRNENECDPLIKSSIIVEVKNNKDNKMNEDFQVIKKNDKNIDNKEKDENVIDNKEDKHIIDDNIITKEELISEYSDYQSEKDNATNEMENEIKDENIIKENVEKEDNNILNKDEDSSDISDEAKEKIEDIIDDIINPLDKDEHPVEKDTKSNNNHNKKVRTRKKKRKKKN